MTDQKPDNEEQEEQPVEFVKEKDLFGLEKPGVDPAQEAKIFYETEDRVGDAEVFIPGAPYSLYQPVRHFVILNVLSLGLYQLYWFYKHWRYLRDEKGMDVYPVCRALFSIIFGYSLFKRFNKLANEKGFAEDVQPGLMFFLYLLLSFSYYLPDYLALLSLFAFMPLIPPLKMMNFYYRQEQANYNFKTKLSSNEKTFLVFFWIVGLFLLYIYV